MNFCVSLAITPVQMAASTAEETAVRRRKLILSSLIFHWRPCRADAPSPSSQQIFLLLLFFVQNLQNRPG